MRLIRRRRRHSDTSNTWWLFVCLCISYFLYRWHLIYSITTSWPSRTLGDYWLTSGGYFPGIYILFLLTFILFAAWSVVEMLCAVADNKADKLVAIVVNPLILLFLCALFYGFSKQWELLSVQSDIQRYSETVIKPRADSHEAEGLFRQFLAQQYCNGQTERLYPGSPESRNQLYTRSIDEGWVRPEPPPGG